MNPTQLLLINGNTTDSITQSMATMARDYLGADVSISSYTAPWGSAYIKTRQDCAVAAHAVLETAAQAIREAQQPFDAGLVACFGEPGLGAVRELASFPVVGMAEAAVLSALQLGQRYVIVTPGQHWPGMLWELLRAQALETRCGGIIPVVMDGLERSAIIALVKQAVEQAVREYQADVVIVGGAAFAGIPAELKCEVPVPVVDSLYAALSQTLGLALLRQS